MQFELIQRYDAPADAVNLAYADPDLYPTLVGLPKLGGVELLSDERDDERAHIRVRFRFTGHLAPAVTAVVHPERLTWVQESMHDLTAGTARFRLLPDHYPDRFRASGTFRIEADGSGCHRVVAGAIQVRAPLVARRVESAIVSGLAEYLEAEAPAVDAFLAR